MSAGLRPDLSGWYLRLPVGNEGVQWHMHRQLCMLHQQRLPRARPALQRGRGIVPVLARNADLVWDMHRLDLRFMHLC